MRVAALVLVSALALAACGKGPQGGAAAPGSPQASSGATTPGGAIGAMFPNLFQASYRMEATMSPREGESMPMTMIRSGLNMRTEMDVRGQHVVTIHNATTHQGYTLMNMAGHQVAMQIDLTGVDSSDPLAALGNREGYTITRGGPCSGAGLTGTEWTSTKAADANGGAAESHTVCATSDGIVLQVKNGDRVFLQTTSVQRGPQDPALFTLPPGVQVMNMGNAASMIAAARGHSKP
jgi:hypothetical protein